MADRSHLTPVRTVDRRGWATTVYRRLTSGPRAAKTMLPARPKLSRTSAPTTAALPAPPPRSRSEIAAFGRKLENKAVRRDFRRMASTEEGRAAASLALDMVDSRALSEEAALGIVGAAWLLDAGHLADSLRIGAVVDAELRRSEVSGGGWWRDSFNGRVQAIVNGLRRDDPLGAAVVTDEESLAGAAAVTIFAYRASPRILFSNHVLLPNGSVVDRIYLKDEELEDAVRSHPDQFDQIMQYSADHDLTKPEGVRALRAALDGGIAAPLAGGWL